MPKRCAVCSKCRGVPVRKGVSEMAKWRIEYLIGTTYEVEIEADSPAEAAEIFETRYDADPMDMEIHGGTNELEASHTVTHIGHA